MQTANLDDFIRILNEPAASKAALPSVPLTDDYAQRKARAVLYAAKADGQAEGNRNASAYSLAARVREKFDLNDADLLEVLGYWNQRNSPSLSDTELVSVVANAERYAKNAAGSGLSPLKSNDKTPAQNEDAPERRIKHRSFADIEPRTIEYLIPEFLPRGVLVSLVSQEGCGKSTLVDYIASLISRGDTWPVTDDPIERGDIVLFSHEQDAHSMICPRLIANGADRQRVHLGESVISKNGLESEFNFDRDIDVLEDWADELPNLRLVVFDPITSYTEANENSNSEVRHALKPLVDFAARRNVTILALSHLSKKVDLGMINRTLGSRAWSAVPRMIWGLQSEEAEDADGNRIETDNRFLLCIKSNLCRKPRGMKFTIFENGRLNFDTERLTMNIDEKPDVSGGITASRANQIGEWLVERIGIDAVPQKDIADEACKKFNIGSSRLGKIATDHGISKRRSVAENCWVWSVKR